MTSGPRMVSPTPPPVAQASTIAKFGPTNWGTQGPSSAGSCPGTSQLRITYVPAVAADARIKHTSSTAAIATTSVVRRRALSRSRACGVGRLSLISPRPIAPPVTDRLFSPTKGRGEGSSPLRACEYRAICEIFQLTSTASSRVRLILGDGHALTADSTTCASSLAFDLPRLCERQHFDVYVGGSGTACRPYRRPYTTAGPCSLRGTSTRRLNSATSTPSWLRTRVWTRTVPRSGFVFDSRFSSTSVSQNSVSP